MEKKIRAVQRWLDRCLAACGSRSWENALADMECAAAELENARRSLWSVVDGRETVHGRKLVRSLGTAIAATVFVLMAAFPLSSPDPVRSAGGGLAWQDQKALLELVTWDERELLRTLRTSLSGANLASAPSSASEPPKETRRRRRQVSQADEEVSETRAAPSRRTVPLDEMMSLIEIGQRALRSDGALVIVGETNGR